MDSTVSEFYAKNAEQGYGDEYDSQHGPRIDWVINRFKLGNLRDSVIADVGCGRGNYFSRLPDPSSANNRYFGFDGAKIGAASKIKNNYTGIRVDFDQPFGHILDNEATVDFLICSETLEHCSNLHNVMMELKKLLKPNGKALFTVPDYSMLHPTAFPGIFFPAENFQVFIEQYAWIVEDFAQYPGNWKSNCFLVRNAPMSEQIPLFPKGESKFVGKNPIEWTNI